MPYRVEYRPTKEGKNWAKINKHTGRVVSRHRSKQKALASIRAYYATRNISLVANARKNPLRVDPTRTLTIRRQFIAEVNRRFRQLRGHIREFLVEKDALGLKERGSFVSMQINVNPRQYEFLTDAGKVNAFRDWLSEQIQADILSVPPGADPSRPWMSKYIDSSYRRGLTNAWLESNRSELAAQIVGDQSLEEFLRGAFNAPETISKIELLATRSFNGMKGITDNMGSQMNRILAQGIADGRNPVDIAREMNGEIRGITKKRAHAIARTECLTGDTIVDGADVDAVFRRWYDGPVVEIVGSSGNKFTATPNHPMLTQDGWVAAGLLNQSHRLIRSRRGQYAGSFGDDDINTGPAKISEIFDSVSAVGIVKRKCTIKPDFHGDGMDGQVDIASPNRHLTIGSFAPIYKEFVESSFSEAGKSGSRFCRFCSRLLSIDQQSCLCASSQYTSLLHAAIDKALIHPVGIRYGLAGLSGAISANNFWEILLQRWIELVGYAAFFPSQLLGLRVAASGSGCSNNILNPAQISPFSFGDVPGTQTGDVEFDNVVSVRFRQFSGHVYNLQTSAGYFNISDGYFSGNTIHAHSEGQLDAFEELGVKELGVKAEWSTAGDDRVCVECASMEGKVFSMEEARGLIPLHVACRCAWIPFTEDAEKKIKAR